MKNDLTCGLVRDLLPSYAENLTCDETNRAVMDHLEQCAACRSVYEEMIEGEAAPEDLPEIDYLKKVKRAKRRVWIMAICAVFLATGGLTAFFLLRGSMPRYSYDGRNLVISGTGEYERLKLPEKVNAAVNLEVQDDQFHLSAYLPAIQKRLAASSAGEAMTLQDFIPGYADRTEKSLTFLHAYLQEHVPEAYSPEDEAKFVEISVQSPGTYTFSNQEDRIVIRVGDSYWHWEEAYLLALMNTKTVEWQQLGFAWYLCYQDPNMEQWGSFHELALRDTPYGESYLAAGGATEDLRPEDYRKLQDAISWACLTQGMRWGTPYESWPVTEVHWFSGPQKNFGGNTMSVCMATSFVGWLAEQYGLENTGGFCFNRLTFEEAFGTDYSTAYNAWSRWILEAYDPSK